MLKFFNGIRKSLIEQNQMGKYLKYAIGEILLVVIGILIALQINNWNEENSKRKKLETYLIALKQELNSNLIRLDKAAARSKRDYTKSVETMRKLNSDSAKYFTSKDIAKRNIGPVFKIELYSSVFKDIISTGVLENLQDLELKKKIFRIDKHLADYDEDFENAKNIWVEYMLPYHSKHANVPGLWDSINSVALPKLTFKNDIKAFVYNRDYANMLGSRARMVANLENSSLEIKQDFENIIENIDNYLNDD